MGSIEDEDNTIRSSGEDSAEQTRPQPGRRRPFRPAAGRGKDEFTYMTDRESLIRESHLVRSSKHDVCIGKVCFGKSVRGERERDQFVGVLVTPRTNLTVCHPLS